MNLKELLLLALAGWTVVGGIGVAVSLWRGERTNGVRHLGWIAGVWAGYLGILMATSLLQPQRVVAIGQDQCFDKMCFAVTGVEEVPGFLVRDGSRLIRLSVRLRNRDREEAQNDRLMRAYLVDAQGRRWEESMGVSGVSLRVKVPAGGSVVSEPVFKIAKDASGLGLVFTHGRRQPGVLEIGDSDSVWHRRTVVNLGR